MALSVDDRLAILELAARYNQAIDGADAEGWAGTFTPDGVFEGRTTARGREELMAFVRERAASERAHYRHWNSNAVIEGDGDRATMRLYLLTVSPQEQDRFGSSGVYHDELVRVGGQWKFQRRRVQFDQA